jgi:hypothetical protein
MDNSVEGVVPGYLVLGFPRDVAGAGVEVVASSCPEPIQLYVRRP